MPLADAVGCRSGGGGGGTAWEELQRHRSVAPRPHVQRKLSARRLAPACAEETPIHSKLLLHYARRLCTKQGALPPPDLLQLVTAEAVLLVGAAQWNAQGSAGSGRRVGTAARQGGVHRQQQHAPSTVPSLPAHRLCHPLCPNVCSRPAPPRCPPAGAARRRPAGVQPLPLPLKVGGWGGHAWARPGGRSRRLHLRLRNVERARRQLPAGALSNLFPALLPAATNNQQPTTNNPSRRFLSNSGLAGNQKACEAAWSILSDSYRTPLHLLHPPHVLALGALCLAATITQLDLQSWLDGLTADFQTVGGWVPATLRWLGVG